MDLQKTYSIKGLKENFGHIKRVEQSIISNAPSLGVLVRGLGVNKIETYIKFWIINLQQSLGLKRGLSENQIDETAFLIVNSYRSMKVTDIQIIFNDAKLGKYGEFFESLTMGKILLWFREYEEERVMAHALKNRRDNESYKYNSKRNQEPTKLRDSKHIHLDSKDLETIKNK